MTHIEIALVGLTTTCLVLLPIALLFLRRIARELVSLNRHASKISDSKIDGITQPADTTTVLSAAQSSAETGDSAQGATKLTELSDSVAEMKRDFEWLVSDRMIELAINMAGTGQSQERIAKHTGISTSELDAIRKVAKH
jgi:hypothetical protein